MSVQVPAVWLPVRRKFYDEMSLLCKDLEGVKIEMQKDLPHLGVVKTGCQGLCELGPLMRIEPYNYQYVKVQPEDCREIVEKDNYGRTSD